MYKMSSPIVEIIESSNVKCFLKSLRRHGEVLTLDEMYARDKMECNKIAVGIIKHKYEFVEEGGIKLLKIDLKEVYSNGQEGKLFHMFLFGSFAVVLKDKKLKNAYVAFRSVNVENNTSHRTQKGDHDLQALLGCPVKKGAKIFLFVELRNNNHKNSAVLPAKRKRVAHVAIDEERPRSSVVEVEPPRAMYKYKKISELVTPENKVNMYGVVAQILRGVEDPDKHAILRVIDETCKEDQYFRVHIFFRNDRINPRFDVGDIVRFHRMKVEEYYNVIDGRIFRASDMVTFPPKGTGKEGAYSTAQSYHFADSDKLQLAELRKWIQSRRKENKPRDSVLMIGNVSEKGTYKLGCKVLRVDKVADDMLILIVTDCIPGKTGSDQIKKKEMKIVAVEPPDQLKIIPVNTDVILNNVEVDVTFVPGEEQDRIIVSYKMVGPSCTFSLLRRFEDEAVTQRKLLRNLEQSEEENNTADNILKQMFLFNSPSEKLKHSLELQNIDDGMKQVLLTQMKEAAADNNVGRSQRTQDSAHFGNSDYSVMGVLEKLIENSQMSRSTPIPDAPKENTECHALPSTSKSNSIVTLSPQKINREVTVSDKLQRKISVPKSTDLAYLQAIEPKQQRGETNENDGSNAACCMQDKSPNLSGSDTGNLPLNSPRNASSSEKCGIPAKDNVLQSRKLTSTPNDSHQIDDTSDMQDSNNTTTKKVPRKIFTLSPDMPNATCISNKQDLNKIMNNILVRVVEKHCTSFEDEKLTNPFTHHLLKNKSKRRNTHQGSGSNYTGSNCRLPTKDDIVDREMRDRSEKNLSAERRTAQDTHLSHREITGRLEKVVKNGSSSQQLVTIEQSKKDSLLTILPITNKGEAKHDGINYHSPECNNPSTFKEIAQVESQKQSLEITSHPALGDVSTYDSHPMQTHNIRLIPEQQKLPHSVENVDTRNEELLPTSDFSKNISEADTGRKLSSAVREFSDNEIELTTKESSDVTYSQFASVSKKNSGFCTSTQSSRNVSSDPVSQAEESRGSPTSEDRSKFASDITDLPGLIAASISHVKQQEVHEETIFVLKAWLTKIEPSIDLTQKFPVTDIIFGSCHSCSKHYSCRAINYEVKHKAICKNCHEQGKKVLLNLSFLLRLHLLDENDDSLLVTLCGPNAVDFLGCTVELYLGDECIFNRVNKALSHLILQDKHLPPTNRGLMLKLIISPILSSKGVEYIMHNTFLYIDKCS